MLSRSSSAPAENVRIDSWKGIAAFFGRDERTVRRWEKERSLPVHRLPGERGGVFAWSHELTGWLHSNRAETGGPEPSVPLAPAKIPTEEPAVPRRRPSSSRTPWTAGAATLLVLAVLTTGFLLLRDRRGHSAASAEAIAGPTMAHVPDRQAEEFYLRGRYYWSRRTDGSLNQAVDAFSQAIVQDTTYAKAWAGLAESYDLMPEYSSMPRSEAFPHAITAATRAVALDDSLPEAHRALAFGLFWWDWNVPRALTEFQRAIQLDPASAETHHWYATALLQLGRYPQALSEIDRAQRIDPASRSIVADQALIYMASGNRAAGIARLEEIEQAEPDFISAPRYLARDAFIRGDFRVFIEQLKRAAAISKDPQEVELAAAAQRGWQNAGRRGMLQAMLTVQQRYFDNGQSSGYDLAQTCALLGRNQDALRYLRAAFDARDYLLFSAPEPEWPASLRADPQFAQIQKQIRDRLAHPA
jgi:tetratricopeptide (TPR) repeat protein